MSTQAVDGIGWDVEYDDGGGTYVDVPNPDALPPLGATGEFRETTHLGIKDRTRTFARGLQAGTESEMVFQFLEDNADQAGFLTLAEQGATVTMRFTGPPDSTNTNRPRWVVQMVLNGYQLQPPTIDGNMLVAVACRDTGAWTKSSVSV